MNEFGNNKYTNAFSVVLFFDVFVWARTHSYLSTSVEESYRASKYIFLYGETSSFLYQMTEKIQKHLSKHDNLDLINILMVLM